MLEAVCLRCDAFWSSLSSVGGRPSPCPKDVDGIHYWYDGQPAKESAALKDGKRRKRGKL